MRIEFRKVVYRQRSQIVHGSLLYDIDEPMMSVGRRSHLDVLCVQGAGAASAAELAAQLAERGAISVRRVVSSRGPSFHSWTLTKSMFDSSSG
jgi:hypothetical protein